MAFRRNEVVKVKRETLAFWADMLRNIAGAVERGEKHPFKIQIEENSPPELGPAVPELIRNYADAIDKTANKGKE